MNTIISDQVKLLYVDNVEKFNNNYLPIYKKCDNGKYIQLCMITLSDDILQHNADPTDIIYAIDNFSKIVFNELARKMNIKFVDEDKEEKNIVIKKCQIFQYQNFKNN